MGPKERHRETASVNIFSKNNDWASISSLSLSLAVGGNAAVQIYYFSILFDMVLGELSQQGCISQAAEKVALVRGDTFTMR